MQLLHDRTKIFTAEKNWEGLDGMVVTDEMRVTIAAQACIMLLGVNDFYFDNVKSVLIFPDTFQREINDGTGVGAQHLSGEAWQGGPIVLSWNSVLRGCRNESSGNNVVIHEFAHALDGLDGEMGGNIVFDDQESRDAWQSVVQQGYDELVDASRAGRRTVLDHYGATNKAEFFAVATEAFFEQPVPLRRHHAQLYELLVKYFRIDPSLWH